MTRRAAANGGYPAGSGLALNAIAHEAERIDATTDCGRC